MLEIVLSVKEFPSFCFNEILVVGHLAYYYISHLVPYSDYSDTFCNSLTGRSVLIVSKKKSAHSPNSSRNHCWVLDMLVSAGRFKCKVIVELRTLMKIVYDILIRKKKKKLCSTSCVALVCRSKGLRYHAIGIPCNIN